MVFYLLQNATNKNVRNKKYNKKTGFPDASAEHFPKENVQHQMHLMQKCI